MIPVMFLILLIWIFSNKGNDKYLGDIAEVLKDYRNLIDTYKVKWDFESIEMPKKAQAKFTFEEFYKKTPEKNIMSVQFWALGLYIGMVCLVSFLVWQIAPYFIAIIAPTLIGSVVLDSWLSFLAFAIPVAYVLYINSPIPRRLRKDKRTYPEVMKSELFKLEYAVQKMQDSESESSRVARELRLAEAAPKETAEERIAKRNADLLNKSSTNNVADLERKTNDAYMRAVNSTKNKPR